MSKPVAAWASGQDAWLKTQEGRAVHVRVVLLLAVLAAAGCATKERPEAIVYASAVTDVEGAWDLGLARRAVESMGYEVDGGGPHGFSTKARDGHTVFAQGPDAGGGPSRFTVAFRVDDADVCSTPTYDAWVDAFLGRVAPTVASRVAAFENATGWTAGGSGWDVTAADRDGNLLRFPDHCGRTVACVGREPCPGGSRWQDGPYAQPEPGERFSRHGASLAS